MITTGKSEAVNLTTFVFTPDNRSFVALMSGPFCLQLTALESLALADLMREAAVKVCNGESSATLTMIRRETWSVVATDTGSVALVRKAIMVRLTVDEADRFAEQLEVAADAMSPVRFGEVANV